jgi:DNA-binding transcriptional ArsR family regulator
VQLETLARKAGMKAEAAATLADGLRSPSINEWTFVMLSPDQNAAVVLWLRANSKRPQVAMALWAVLFSHLHRTTGEIMQTRAELAARVGTEPDNLSRIMAELESINAVRKERDGRRVRYFLNANIATHIPGPAARKAAREGSGPLLKIMDGGRG